MASIPVGKASIRGEDGSRMEIKGCLAKAFIQSPVGDLYSWKASLTECARIRQVLAPGVYIFDLAKHSSMRVLCDKLHANCRVFSTKYFHDDA